MLIEINSDKEKSCNLGYATLHVACEAREIDEALREILGKWDYDHEAKANLHQQCPT